MLAPQEERGLKRVQQKGEKFLKKFDIRPDTTPPEDYADLPGERPSRGIKTGARG